MRQAMKLWTLVLAIAVTSIAAGASIATSGSEPGVNSGEATLNQTTQAKSTGSGYVSTTNATAAADAQASAEAEARLQATFNRIRDKGQKVSLKARTDAQTKLRTEADKVDREAVAAGDAKIAARLAKEFDTSADVLMEQREQMGVSWGELVIANTLAANSSTDLTAEDLWRLHAQGEGWGTIAAGLGLRLGDCVSAVRSEGRVALGTSRADGRVAVVGGEGSRAGAGAGVHTGLGVHAGGAHMDAGAGVKAGVKVGR